MLPEVAPRPPAGGKSTVDTFFAIAFFEKLLYHRFSAKLCHHNPMSRSFVERYFSHYSWPLGGELTLPLMYGFLSLFVDE